MTSQQNLVCDASSVANFKQWGQAISTFFSTAGWTQSSDTGQVNWTSIASVPGSNSYVYEIWKPGDALTAFFLKVEYGNVNSTNSPSLRFSISVTTNGSGTLTGTIIGPISTSFTNFTTPSSSTQYECDFSGSNNRVSALLWRNGTNNCQQAFAVERSLDASGAYTGSYVTIVAAGSATNSADWAHSQQQTLVFGVGAGPTITRNSGSANSLPCLCVRKVSTSGGSTLFNGNIPFDTVAPNIGYFDYPMTSIGVAASQDVTEGVAFSVTLYGATRTYMPHLNSDLRMVYNTSNSNYVAFCVRYD